MNNIDRNISKERQSNFELLRIIVMVMIVCYHFFVHGGFEFDMTKITVPRLWWELNYMSGNMGVVVFVFITGFFLVESKRFFAKPKKMIKLYGQIFFYSVVLFLSAFLIGKGDKSPQNIIETIFPISYMRWWFASTYFVLFLIHPFLNRVLKSFQKTEYQIFLFILIIISSIIPMLSRGAFLSSTVIEFVLYYSIAGYIKIFGFHSDFSSKKWFICWLVITLLTYLIYVVLMFLGTKYSVFNKVINYINYRHSLFTIIRAICFFMMFYKLKIKSNKIINILSSASFGVYLLHDSNLLRGFLWKDIFKNSNYQNTIRIIPYSIMVTIIVYIACTVIDLIRIYCFETPFMSIVDILSKKKNNFFNKVCGILQKVVFGIDN